MPKLKIGYAPYRSDLQHPADRRRLMYWAQRRDHKVILDLSQKFDVLFLSSRADLTFWTESSEVPIIIDLVDGYLGNEVPWRDWVRGTSKVLSGQITGLPRPFRKIIKDACQLAKAVVCETIEQKETILPYCKNTHAILDFHEEFPMLPFNPNPKSTNFPALLWEGLPFTATGILQLRECFLEMTKSNSISLELVTDLEFPIFLGKHFYKSTLKILDDIPDILGKNLILTKWDLEAVIKAARRSHISVLPLDPAGSLNPLKAENRLLMMWRIGLPVITSPSFSYLRVMQNTQIDGICHSSDQWPARIMEFMDSVKLRKECVERGQQYIRDTHSKEIVLQAWDNLFESVL